MAFINKNVWRNELLENMTNGDKDNKATIEESLKRNSDNEPYKLKKTSNSFEIIKVDE